MRKAEQGLLSRDLSSSMVHVSEALSYKCVSEALSY
jgi:hypothetical protein